MKPLYFSKLMLLTAIILGWNLGVSAQIVTFNYTGSVQAWTVPAGITSVAIDMQGANGGYASSTTYRGGYGARVQCNLSVTPLSVLYIYVGGAGAPGTTCCGGYYPTGGFNGGGTGYNYGPGGGGGTDIRTSSSGSYVGRLVVAGGGGGGDAECGDVGGAGGGSTGGNGIYCGSYNSSYCGAGGTQTSGGSSGSACGGGSSGAGFGANSTTCYYYGGAGGGGYYGGGSGSNYGSGGGGSSFANLALCSSITMTPAFNTSTTGNGVVTITGPTVIATPSPLSFGGIVVGSTSAPQSFTMTGVSLSTSPLTVTAPTDFLISTSSAGTYTHTLAVTFTPPTLAATPIYVKFSPAAYSVYSSNVTIAGGGLSTPATVLVTGTGNFACTGAPAADTASIAPAAGGSATPFTLSLNSTSLGGGLTYQWQKFSVTGGGTGFTNIVGAVTPTYNFTGITANTYFRCVVSCPAGGSSVSNTVLATLSPAAAACTGLPVAGTVTADVTAGCAPTHYASVLTYSSTDASSGLAYNWQSSTTSSTAGFTNIPGATSPVFTASVGATIWYQMLVTCVPSSGFAVTDPRELDLNPLPASITGINSICTAVPTILSDATSGGSWTSSNSTIAGAGLGTGIITGFSPGVATISYTLSTGCYSTSSMTVNTSPGSILGSGTVCAASNTTLTDVTVGGSWLSSNTAAATVGTGSGVVSGVSSGTAVITYMVSNGCYSFAPLVVNPLPAPISGSGSVCIGASTNYTDATTGGSWMSTNAFQAAVGSASGIISGIAAGTPSVSYILPTGCKVGAPVVVNVLPAAISGASTVCVGQTIGLTDAGGGTWSSSNTSVASVNPTSGVVTGVAGGSANVSYTISTGCTMSSPVTVNILPLVNAVTGGGGYCPGGTGVHVGLASSQPGVNYELYYGTAPTDRLEGSGAGVDFGLYTAAGGYTVVAIDSITGCMSNMSGSAVVSISSLPTVFAVTGGGPYCAGGNGVHITTSGSELGTTYQLIYGGGNLGLPVSGTGAGLDFGLYTGAGAYTVVATNGSTLCTSNMSGSAIISISPVPAVFNVAGGGPVCVGAAGADIYLDGSAAGIEYQLYNGGTAVHAAIDGGTGRLDYGLFTAAGDYTIVARDITNHCTSAMAGDAMVTVNPLPVPVAVTGGGNYCAGGPGVHIGVNYSYTGTSYQLRTGTVSVGPSVSGANSGLDFGAITVPGTFNVLATINTTGCTATMTGGAVIASYSLPTLHNVTGTGGYCAGGTGRDVTLDASQSGIRYQLYRDGIIVGTVHTGAGPAIDFGTQVSAGTYTIGALNATTGCTNTMAGSAVITVNPLPTAYTVMGGGNYCAGGTGAHVMLSNSDVGIDYKVYLGATYLGSVAGTGAMLDLGMRTGAGIYTVVGMNHLLGCTNNMNGTATISTLPAPAAYAVTGGGSYCAGGTGQHVGLALSSTGVSYQLVDSSSVITLLGTGGPLDFGIQTATGTYTVLATNTATSCTNTMTGSAVININALPAVYNVTGGGMLCAGDAGVAVMLDNTTAGISYQLYDGGSPSGGAVTGSGTAGINFGLKNIAGTYTVVAKNTGTTCTNAMAGTAVVVVNPLPAIFNVTGGGSYCAGGTGVHLGLSGSDVSGVLYQAYNSGTAVGSGWAGTGLALDLGADTGEGIYNVVATNPVTGCHSTMAGTATISITPSVTPAVTVSSASGSNNVCADAMNTFTATSVNGGLTPVYEWLVNGGSVGFGSTYAYAPHGGDVVVAILTSDANCAMPAIVTNSMTVVSVPNQVPAVVAVATPGAVICPGTSVTYMATPIFGGTAPSYVWKKNGTLNVGTGSSFTYTPTDSDVIFVTMSSNYTCVASPFAVSNSILMHLDVPQMPVFTISANPGTSVVSHTLVTFTADVTNVNPDSVNYQWAVNNNPVGINSPSFTSRTLQTYDVVSCTVSSHNECGVSAPANHGLTMVVNSLGVGQVTNNTSDVKLIPNPNNGTFTVKGSLGSADAVVNLEVTNMLGQVVYRNTVNAQNGNINEQISLGNTFPNGMYILNLRSGTENTVFHFVIEQ